MAFKKGYKHSEEAKRKISKAMMGNQWNKGRVLSEETREKISEALKKAWQENDWSERNKKISKARKGMKLSEETKKKVSEALRGERNPGWKGVNVGYKGLHRWVVRELGRPTQCEFCGKDGLSGNGIHWANKDHKYKRNLEDWLRLCIPCHKQYDGERLMI